MDFTTAVQWALKQGAIKTEHQDLVDKVREYFNVNKIPYETFSYKDLISHIPN